MRVWVTRAQPGAEATARAVRALGHEALVAPLIETSPLPFDPPDPATYAALAFTSAAGVRAFSARATPRPGTPAWAVGRATAAAVRAAGWTLAGEADGDGRALADLLAGGSLAPAGRVLAPGAREPAFDLAAALSVAGIAADTLAVYATAPVHPAPPDAVAALHAGDLDAVLLHSPSAARALDAAAPAPPVRIHVLALSPACLPTARGWLTQTAPAPRERDLLALLGRSTAASAPAKSRPPASGPP